MAKVIIKSRVPSVKLIQIGNSLGLVLPSPSLRSARWRKGDLLIVSYYAGKNEYVIRNLSSEIRKNSEEGNDECSL